MLKTSDPRSMAVVEGPVSLASNTAESPGRVQVLRYLPEKIELLVVAGRDSFLVAAEGYAPGWQARVDGKPARVYPANVAFMGVPIPAGRHHVALTYRPVSLYWAAAVSVFSWLGLILWSKFK